MPANAEVLLDTSAAVPFLLRGHAAHASTLASLRGRSLGLAGHAALETYSVITRLPEPSRVSPATAVLMLKRNFPHTVHLSVKRATGLVATLAETGISGGAVYDGLVGAAALEHGLTLVTRDLRATDTYTRLGVDFTLLQ